MNQLETRVTRYRNFNILLCLLLVTVVTVAQADLTDVIRTKKLEIVNDAGQPVVELRSFLGEGRVRVNSADGKKGNILFPDKDVP